MDDTTNSRASDAAATRKRRSSILKSYRPPRAPFSELEFNVATPTDTAKSRRVSFSRRTGVAEFATNEATTTWKNFYEEHNKTLESSGNDSEVNPPRPSVGHLGKRIFDQQFQEVDANDLLTPDDGGRNVDNSVNNENLFRQFNVLESVNDLGAPAPLRKFELSSFTNNQSQIFADEFCVSGLGEVSDRISVNFTDVQLLSKKDDLEDIEKDLKRQSNVGNMIYSNAFRAADVSEYIEIDLNLTHIAAKNDESDMSITDTIHSSEVNVSKIHTDMKSSSAIDCKHWVINKENIAINPYVAPKESANFAINEEPDKILVFDGKRLTRQTELKENINRTSVTDNASTISLKKPIVLNVDDDLPNFVDNPQASISQILPNDSHSKSQSMVIGDEAIKVPVSEANLMMPDSLERRRTILYESNAGDISVTQAVPPNIILPESIASSSDTSKTVVFKNEDITPAVLIRSYPSAQAFSLNVIGYPDRFDVNEVLVDRVINIPVTHAVSSNVTLLQEYVPSVATTKNIVSASEMENMSMTQVVSENIILPDNTVPEHRKTIVFESDNDISMTQAVLENVILPENQDIMPKNGKTIVFNSEDEDMSMTEAVLINDIISVNELPEISGKRKTIILESDHDISMTQAVPRNIILCENQAKRKTIVFNSEDADISMTQAIPTNIIVPEGFEKRKTIVFESGNEISMTQAVPANIILNVSEKRKTIVYESDNDISITQAVPRNMLVAADESVKQAMPSNIIPDNAERQDNSMSIGNVILIETKKINDHTKSKDISVTQAVKLNTVDHNQESLKKSALNCNKIGIAVPNVDNVNESKCDLDVSKYTNVPERKIFAEESDIDVKINTQPLPASLQLLPENIITPNDSASSTSLSSSSKETAKKRLSQEMTITEFNNTDKEIEEPQVTIHTHSKLNKIFRTEKMSNLSITKPIPADLLTIQKILDKSNVSQLLSEGQEKEPINQNFMVYQTNTDMGVIPSVNTEADSILKDPVPSATNDLSRTDLQHNKGQIELFRTENNWSPSLKDMTNLVPKSKNVSKSPSNKSKMSNVTSESMPIVSNSESQDRNSLSNSLPEVCNSSSCQSRFLSETLSQQPKDGNTTQGSKKSLLVDLLDMSFVSVTSGLEDKSATAKIESDNSMNKEIESNFFVIGESEEKVVKPAESLFYINSGSEDEKSEEGKKMKPKEVPLPLSIYNKEMSDGNCSKNNMIQYLQQKLDQLKDKMPCSSDKESFMTEQLLQMLADFTDVEEQTNPLGETSISQDQNKFLSIATRKTAGHGSNHLQQNFCQLKDKMTSSRHLEKLVSPDKESYMTEQLLKMLDDFTDVEEQTNPLHEINIKMSQDQNKFLSLATRNTAGHGSNQKGKTKNKPMTPRSSTLHGSPSGMASSPQVRSASWQGSSVKRGLKKESSLPPRSRSPSFYSLVSPRKPNAGHESSLHRYSATKRASSPRKKTTCKKDKSLISENESPTDKDNELHKYTSGSDNELVYKIIEEVSALDEHSSEEYPNEVRKTYLTNDKKELSVEDNTEFIRNKELCDQINEIMKESRETLISNDLLHSPMKGINSANDIDVPKEKGEDNLVSQSLNEKNLMNEEDINYVLKDATIVKELLEKNLMNEEDISSVLKDATIVKELLYPMEDTNITDDNNIRKQDTVGEKLLAIENKNTEDTGTLPSLMTRPAISAASSLENLIPKRQSSINPRRQSVVFSREELMNNISLAQAILQKELEETPIDEDEQSPKSNYYEKKMHINNEVVKSLRFEDDEVEVSSESIFGLSTLKSNTSSFPLKKTVFGETSYMNDFKTSQKVNVIPSYLKDVSDGIKQLMNDLMKPDADADVLPFADTKTRKNKEILNEPSTRNSEAQADLFTSSQIDLQREPVSTVVSQQPCTTTQQRGIVKVSSNKSVTAAFDMCPPKKALKIILFDPGNPLNNIYIKPADFADAHRYEPLYPNGFPDCTSGNCSKDNSIERMFTHYNIRTIRSSFTKTEENQNYKQKHPEEKNSQDHDLGLMSRSSNMNRSWSVNKAIGASEVTSRDAKMNTVIAMRDNLKILQAHSSLTLVNEAGDSEAKIDVSVHSFPLNRHDQTSGVKIIYEQHNEDLGEMRNDQSLDQIGNTSSSKRKYSSSGNYHRLCTVSSLDITPKPAKKIAKRSTSPDEMLNYDMKTTGACQLPPLASRSKNFNTCSHCSPVKYAQIGSCLKSPKDQNNKSPNNKPSTEDGSKSPTGNTKQARITLSQKDASKRQRSTTVRRLAVDGMFNKPNRQQIEPYVEAETVEYISKQNVEYYVNEISTSSSRSEVTHCASVSTSCGKCTGVTMDWLPELINELSSKNLVTECESDINVLQMIDALPFIGTPECSWESGDCETWSFYFLHERLRLRIELAPQRKGCNDKGACVRSDTPVLDLKIDNLHQDKRNSVAVVCVKFAAEAMRYLLGRSGVYTRAGDVPALLRRCAGVSRVSLKWGRAMHTAWSHLAFTMTEEGLLSLKVANLSLRSVWEVTMHLELVVEDAREVPWPKASNVQVTSVISDHKVARDEVHRVLHHMKKDWGHVPRTIWKIFKYLKHKTREGDLLLA